MRLVHPVVALTVAALLLAACGGSDTEPDDATDLPVVEQDEEAEDGDESAPPDDGASGSDPLLGPEIEVAMVDLVERAGVDRGDVLIEVTELVTWPDGALGCPEEGQMYTQALVDGYRLVFSAAGTEYHYHGASDEDPAYCAEPATDGMTAR